MKNSAVIVLLMMILQGCSYGAMNTKAVTYSGLNASPMEMAQAYATIENTDMDIRTRRALLKKCLEDNNLAYCDRMYGFGNGYGNWGLGSTTPAQSDRTYYWNAH